MVARQQRLLALEQKAAQQQEQEQQQEQQESPAEQEQQQQQEGQAAAQPSTTAAGATPPAAAGSPHSAWMAADAAGPSITTEPSGSSIASIDGQPLRVVVQSGSSSDHAEAGASGRSSGALPGVGSPKGSGSMSSITTDEDTCGICFDNSNHVAIKYCGHRLCVDCYRKVWELSSSDSTCPFCRARLEGYVYIDWPLE
jgi:hypothetical protein